MTTGRKGTEFEHFTDRGAAFFETFVEKQGDRPVSNSVLFRCLNTVKGALDRANQRSTERDETIIALVEQLERRCAALEARIIQLEGR